MNTKDYYENLSPAAKNIAAQVEELLTGLTVQEVFDLTRSLRDKAMNETKVSISQEIQQPA